MSSSNLIQPVKGTRDFYPQDQAFQNWLYSKFKEVAELFGFQEYEGPIIESLDLYAAKSGEELVKKQAFTLADRSGNALTLRPEMTPTLARMVAQKARELTFPVKWFTFGRRFRYEKPQKGRAREFFQWDVDILGPENLEADAEVIAVAATLYQKLGLTPTEVKIKINDRKVLQERFLALEIPEENLVRVFRLADKKDKVTREDFIEMGQENGLSEDQTKAILQILEEKNAYLDSPWLVKIFDLLKKYGVSEYVEYDPGIVRGLEYYTRTVFEGWDVKGEFRAIWGGGRYDNLVADVGGKQKIPGVGFAMGDMVIAGVLKANNKYPTLLINKTQVLVTVFSPELYDKSLKIANVLREENINAETFLDPTAKIDKQLKYADKKGIPYVIIIGPVEAEQTLVVLKNLRTREQITILQADLVKKIKQTS
ncbi:histidine--tRNA ligase [Candidatus Shapirobacteria bacterium CG03_land_8_20_14_0_80_40_19]|uniref:Histidine--tRNA ligase n=1 Tax=Candidatus Shapirobacteria bacterium CG03_land_8_20_14_0_80_40_19 TaxID=1974880 RepID=A0A2M7BF10_9BACT|nr:MAG: histidine--tRNA ligase [Candidatus Shapirobacteria bacterium CG03_land_8_20_14_0_80_40_19]